MSERPLYERSTLAYIAAGIVIFLAGSFLWRTLAPSEHNVPVSQPVFPRDAKRSALPDHTTSRPPDEASAEKGSNKSSNATTHSPNDVQLEALKADCDSLQNRLSAAASSLRERGRDLDTQPMKPEIISAMETCQSDLAAAREALSVRDSARAVIRMNRAKELLKYLESL
jgi:hypothetical protein